MTNNTKFKFTCMSGKQLVLDMSEPQIMGILNTTPDSFSDGGKHNTLDAALMRTEKMLDEGASIIDIGGESTRPNAPAVSEAQEEDRVLQVVEAVGKRFDVVVSIDTSTPKLMQRAHGLGAHIWNDVRALKRESARDMAALLDIPVVIMHGRGEPDTMMALTRYNNTVADVKNELMSLVNHAVQSGVKKHNIIIDVGFGFAKNTAQNYELLAHLHQFSALGFTHMIGLSKKRMLADALTAQGLSELSSNLNARIEGGLAAALMALQQGVRIIRTHDVLATKKMLSVYTAVRNPAIFNTQT